MIDLHLHTTASDGQYSPTELIQKATTKKITTLAITDHDTVAGIEEGKVAAKENGINFVPGVEINIQHFSGEFHLLGLGFTSISDSLKEVLTDVQKNREARNIEMVEKIKLLGIEASLEELMADNPNTVLGRPHFAAYLQKKGIVKTNGI